MPTSHPARIHVLLARANPKIGLIIRRGPSKHVCTILWNRKTDKFSVGQWLQGRIYERRSDLSPDGKYFIYFAMNGKWESETRGSWTAISLTPYLRALMLRAKGDAWNGGGIFFENKRYWLNDGYGHKLLKDTKNLKAITGVRPVNAVGNECLSVYYPRLELDGWRKVKPHATNEKKEVDLFEKSLKKGWVLRKIAHRQIESPKGKGCYWDEHELEHLKSKTIIKCTDWEWADLDQSRLVWATEGKLMTGRLEDKKLKDQKILYDFNGMSFEPLKAPYQ